jgi:hypothetical protein
MSSQKKPISDGKITTRFLSPGVNTYEIDKFTWSYPLYRKLKLRKILSILNAS